MKDLTGQKFGRLTVIREGERTLYGHVKWFCECECGKTKTVFGTALLAGHTQSCGCLQLERVRQSNRVDLTDQTFGRLRVEKEAGMNKHRKSLWQCRCECGNIKIIPFNSLRSGHSRSCGCLHREKLIERLSLDLSGQRFGRLVALERAGKKGGRCLWLCRCDCTEMINVSTGDLRSGHTQSCGCFQSEIASQLSQKDLTGQRFGRLVALCPLEHRKENLPLSVLWVCQCDCKNLRVAVSHNLLRGYIKSCGCLQIDHQQAFGEIGPMAKVVLRELMQEPVTTERLREIQEYL
jgi:hypothetical protein